MTELKVSSYVTVRERCSIRYRVVDDTVEFSFGGPREPFELAFDAGSLREFVQAGTDALRDVDGRGQAPAR
jgi:hypothetical protein